MLLRQDTFLELLHCDKPCIVSVRGKSMLPTIREKKDTVLIVKITRPIKKLDIVLYKRKNEELILHRVIRKDENGGYDCSGDNQWMLERGVIIEQMIGIVKGIYRKEKYISCEKKVYKIYSWIWVKFKILRKTIYFIKMWIKKNRKS